MMPRVWMALLLTVSISGGTVLAQQLPEPRALSVAQKPAPGQPNTDRRVALVGRPARKCRRLPQSQPANDALTDGDDASRRRVHLGWWRSAGRSSDKAHFDRLVQQFGKELPPGADVALFDTTPGDGMQVQGENWLVPVDANPTSARDMDFQMVNAGLVLRQMEGAGTKLNMVILDACRNNPFPIRAIRAAAGGLGEMAAPEGTLISYATQPGNVALDGDTGDSPYTVALVDAIQRPGSDVFHVFNEVGLVVKKGTAGAQQPWLATSPIAGSFYFFSLPAASEASNTASNVAPAALPQATDGSRFDGIWSVEVACPTERGGRWLPPAIRRADSQWLDSRTGRGTRLSPAHWRSTEPSMRTDWPS